jgi:hypothetical protein
VPRTLAALALMAVAVAGCGGGGGELSKTEFVAKADEICKQAHDQFAKDQPASPPSSSSEAADLQKKLIDISEAELSEIRDLNAPSDVQPQLDRYLAAREQGIALLKKGLSAAEHNDAFGYAQAKQQVTATQRHRTELARAVGFKECSSSFAASSG